MELRRRREQLRLDRLQAAQSQHQRGKLTANERIELLLDPGSFVELDSFAVHKSYGFGLEQQKPIGDGVITGYGTISGRPVCLFAHDFTVFGGSLGEVFAEKICKVMDLALRMGIPFIGINDSGGARIQEGVASMGGYSEIVYRNVCSSGVIPQISIIAGPCAGGAVYSPALTDFIFMAKDIGKMFITGPEVVKNAIGENISAEQLGGTSIHSTLSGVTHVIADNELDLFDQVRLLLSFLPANNLEDPPYIAPIDDPCRMDESLQRIIPDKPYQSYNMLDIVSKIIDEGTFFEIQSLWARSIITGFARLDGYTVGVVANQPNWMAGALNIDSADKAARFVRFCDAFNIPIITFVDVPGFVPGSVQEHAGVIRHGAKMLYAYSEATVPKITVTIRKAYGGAYGVMANKQLRTDFNFAWPTAEIATMGSQSAVPIIFRKKLAMLNDPSTHKTQLIEDYEQRFANPYAATERGYIDAVIEPRETRHALVQSLRFTRTKRQTLLSRKHGNIPL